jgi:hypothetical protein
MFYTKSTAVTVHLRGDGWSNLRTGGVPVKVLVTIATRSSRGNGESTHHVMGASHCGCCLDTTVKSNSKIIGRAGVKVVVSVGNSLQSLTKLSVTYFVSSEEVSQAKESESNLPVNVG